MNNLAILVSQFISGDFSKITEGAMLELFDITKKHNPSLKKEFLTIGPENIETLRETMNLVWIFLKTSSLNINPDVKEQLKID